MGKKIFLVLLVVISVFLTFGCSNSSSNVGGSNNSSDVNNLSNSSHKLGAYYYVEDQVLHLTNKDKYEPIRYFDRDVGGRYGVVQLVDWNNADIYNISEIIIDDDVYFDSNNSHTAVCLFESFDTVEKIQGLKKLHIKGYAANLFASCDNLNFLDVENFNTSEITDMSSMFYGCGSLTSLDIAKWNTSNVIDMSGMFWNCNNLISLDIAKWNTSNVIQSFNMFYGCKNLINLNIEKWNTSNVIEMSNMFDWCPAPRPSWYHE